jgi:tRNA dimethylallyltransferase
MKPASSGTEKPSAVAIMGPTASGKSALALSVAKALDGEIVSADSMQLYRGMRIGTAKPSAQELASVPHHLLDNPRLRRTRDLFSFHEAASRRSRR